MKKLAKIILKFLRISLLQPVWEKIYIFSLYCMNIGPGIGEIKESGEANVVEYFKKHLPSGKAAVVFDVGANIGDFASEMLAGNSGKHIEVYCFEPSRETFSKLDSNLKKYTNKKLFNFGFGDKNERLTLYSTNEDMGLASVYNRCMEHFDIKLNKMEEIQLKKMDEFCRENDIQHINFLKLDVEGHELKILKGAQNLLNASAVDYIQFEFGGCNIDSRTYFQDFYYLLSPNYKIYRILQNGFFPIENYRETLEIFVTTNYLAVSKKINHNNLS